MNKQVTSPASGEDRISALPDDIICNILSNLYVEESARTSILSKRWDKMWLLSPITISDESIAKQSCMYCFTPEESSPWIINTMSHIISTHPGSIHACHFTLPDWDEDHDTLLDLLKTLTLKGIRNLQINFGPFNVPCFVFECDSLVDVHLGHGSIPAQLPVHIDIFPNLRKLTLKYYYDLNNEFLVNLLSTRSIIELALFRCYDLKDVVIESISLQKLYFGDYVDVNLTIKDAPNLESLKLDYLSGYFDVMILNAPKLKVLSRIDMGMSKLQLGSYLFDFSHYYNKYTKISGEINYMPYLRSLDIVLDLDCACEVKSVPHFLMCFPCLETLQVSIKDGKDSSDDSDFSDDEYDNVSVKDATVIVVDDDYDDYVHLMSKVNCLNYHLKSVRLSSYYGKHAHLDFARLIVANAKVLETLTIVYSDDFKEIWIKSLKHFLMQNRASKMLQVEFLKKEWM